MENVAGFVFDCKGCAEGAVKPRLYGTDSEPFAIFAYKLVQFFKGSYFEFGVQLSANAFAVFGGLTAVRRCVVAYRASLPVFGAVVSVRQVAVLELSAFLAANLAVHIVLAGGVTRPGFAGVIVLTGSLKLPIALLEFFAVFVVVLGAYRAMTVSNITAVFAGRLFSFYFAVPVVSAKSSLDGSKLVAFCIKVLFAYFAILEGGVGQPGTGAGVYPPH